MNNTVLKSTIIASALLLMPFLMNADPVDALKARKVAENFLKADTCGTASTSIPARSTCLRTSIFSTVTAAAG